VEVPLSPNNQVHEVGEFKDESINCTESGVVPDDTFDINDATGLSAETGLTRNTMVRKTRSPQNKGIVFMLNRPILFFPDMQ
jgi:hypothetical protein